MKYPYRLFIMLTSICNLNCNGCGHFCELNQEHGSWFISLEELRQNLTIVKEKMPHMNHLMLIGGEPLVHPQFLEICQIIREIFPKMDTTIMTNGIALANYSDEDFVIYEILQQEIIWIIDQLEYLTLEQVGLQF